MRRQGSWCHRPVVIAAIGAVGVGCGAGMQSPHEVTAVRMRQMLNALVTFQNLQGQLPERLTAVCLQRPVLCGAQTPEDWNRDGWGRPVSYHQTDGEFELRSAGRDGVAGTGDDLLLLSAVERVRLHRIAGCYRVALSWWEPFEDEFMRLDTMPVGSWYRLRPELTRYDGMWQPVGWDSATVSWIQVDVSMTLRLRYWRDTLLGMAYSPGAAMEETGEVRSVEAVRVPCP